MLQRGYSYPRKATRTRTPVVVRLAHETCLLCNSRIPLPFPFHPAAKTRRQQIFAYLAGLAGGQTNGYLLKRESCWDLHRRARVLSASAPPAPGSSTPPITVPPFLGPPHPAAAGTGAGDSSRGSGEKPLSFGAVSFLIFPDQPSKSQPFNQMSCKLPAHSFPLVAPVPAASGQGWTVGWTPRGTHCTPTSHEPEKPTSRPKP